MAPSAKSAGKLKAPIKSKVASPAKPAGKLRAPVTVAKVAPPVKTMTDEERIIEENRRAKQAILAGLENDGYSSDYYSASDYYEEEAEPEPIPSKPAEKSLAMTAEDDDPEETHSVSPYFAKSKETTTIVTKSSRNVEQPKPSAAAKKFSRSVLAASKIDQKRKPGFADESPVTAKTASDTSMMSLAEKRALAGKKTSFSVLPVDKVAKDKFGNLLKKPDGSKSASSSKAVTTDGTGGNGSGLGSGMKRAPGIFGATTSAVSAKKSAVSASKASTTAPQDSDDDDESDTSIPAFRRPGPNGWARRGGGNFAIRGAVRGSLRGRGRPRASGL